MLARCAWPGHHGTVPLRADRPNPDVRRLEPRVGGVELREPRLGDRGRRVRLRGGRRRCRRDHRVPAARHRRRRILVARLRRPQTAPARPDHLGSRPLRDARSDGRASSFSTRLPYPSTSSPSSSPSRNRSSGQHRRGTDTIARADARGFLTAANVVASAVESVGLFAGPALGALLLGRGQRDGVRRHRSAAARVGRARRPDQHRGRAVPGGERAAIGDAARRLAGDRLGARAPRRDRAVHGADPRRRAGPGARRRHGDRFSARDRRRGLAQRHDRRRCDARSSRCRRSRWAQVDLAVLRLGLLPGASP